MTAALSNSFTRLAEASNAFTAGAYEQTITLCAHALALNPNQAQWIHLLGLAYFRRNDLANAQKQLDLATTLTPSDATLWSNLGAVHEAQAHTELAESSYRHAIHLNNNFANAHTHLGYLLITLDRLDEAGEHCKRAVILKPQARITNFNYAFWLFCTRQFEQTLSFVKSALDASPKHAPTWYLLGQIWRELGNFEKASEAYLRAVELDPMQADAALNFATCQLALEHYALGWHYYFQRKRGVDRADTLSPITPGARFAGKHILLTADQGIGDQLFFLRFAPALVKQGARVSCRPDRKLIPLLKRLPWIDSVLETEQPHKPDYTFAMGDLPLLLQMNSRADIPPPLPLTACPERVQYVAKQLAALGPPPYVAITWRAGKARETAMNFFLYKSIPVTALGASLRTLNATIIIVQRAPIAGELATFTQELGRPAHDFSAFNDDLEDMLALMANVNHYVTVSNTNLHLRASLNLPSQALIAHPSDWRWLSAGTASPWFPGTELYRQAVDGSWTDALEHLLRNLFRLKE